MSFIEMVTIEIEHSVLSAHNIQITIKRHQLRSDKTLKQVILNMHIGKNRYSPLQDLYKIDKNASKLYFRPT